MFEFKSVLAILWCLFIIGTVQATYDNPDNGPTSTEETFTALNADGDEISQKFTYLPNGQFAVNKKQVNLIDIDGDDITYSDGTFTKLKKRPDPNRSIPGKFVDLMVSMYTKTKRYLSHGIYHVSGGRGGALLYVFDGTGPVAYSTGGTGGSSTGGSGYTGPGGNPFGHTGPGADASVYWNEAANMDAYHGGMTGPWSSVGGYTGPASFTKTQVVDGSSFCNDKESCLVLSHENSAW